jgi:hypothetical protein
MPPEAHAANFLTLATYRDATRWGGVVIDVSEIRRDLEHARESVICNADSTEGPLTVDLALDEVDRAILCLARLEQILLAGPANPAMRGPWHEPL